MMKSTTALLTLALLSTFAAVVTSSGLKKIGTDRSRAGILTTYYWSEIPQTCSAASKDCRDNGGSLVAPTSSSVDTTLSYVIIDNQLGTTPLWTDGAYDVAASRWVWSTSKRPFQYFNWRPNQPGAVSSTSYMAVSGTLSTYGWNNYPGNTKLQYVCVNQD